jgi:endonuclease/exonuclease/phosphatase family metal-dependent hydrolase
MLALTACHGPRIAGHLNPEPGCLNGLAPAEVRWIAAPDAGDRPALDRWCAGVGPVVTAARAPRDSLVLDSLPVISWNTHVGGGDIARLVRDLRSGELSAGRPITHFVLLLQEVYREGPMVPRHPKAMAPGRIIGAPHDSPRVDIVATAESLGLELYYVPSMANGIATPAQMPEDRGNAILSTLPLTDLAAIELPYEAQRRIAAAASVRGRTSLGTPWELRMLSVHLDHRSRGMRLLQLGAGRKRQAQALVAALDTAHATVLGGDLNTWAGMLEGAVPVLESHFPVTTASREPTFATASGLGGLRLDRLMFRLPPELSADSRRLRSRYSSDHHPLLGWVRLVPAA